MSGARFPRLNRKKARSAEAPRGCSCGVSHGRMSHDQFEEAIGALARIGRLGETGSDRELVRLTLQGIDLPEDHHARQASRLFIEAEGR